MSNRYAIKLTDAPTVISARYLSRMSAERGRSETIVEAFLPSIRVGETNGPHARLTTSLVHDVDAVAATVATWNALLTVQTKVESSNAAKLTHWILKAAKSGTSARAHGNGTLDAPVGTAIRCKPRGLERQNLVRGKLLLVEGLLLLLQSLDLALQSDLLISLSWEVLCHLEISSYLFSHNTSNLSAFCLPVSRFMVGHFGMVAWL